MRKASLKLNQFFFRHRKKGIPNLMLWIILANILVYFLIQSDPSGQLYRALRFDRRLILQGQLWRLFSYALLDLSSRGTISALIFALLYPQLGRALEDYWGVLKFNIFYLTGLLLSSLGGMLLGYAYSVSLHYSLFLVYATLYPDTTFRLYFIIPIKARWLAIVFLALNLYQLLLGSFLPIFTLANYFLFLGKSFIQVFPDVWQINFRRAFRKKKRPHSKTVPYPSAGSYEATFAIPKAPYTHKCTVCGRSDISDPGLEFRYCSLCKGYHCYCIDHINDHPHIQ